MPHITRLILAFAAVAGCASTEQNKQAVRTLYEQCINRARLELLPELIAADYVGPQGDKGPSGYRDTIEDLRRGFPDIQFRVEQLIAEGDRVAVRWSWTGRHEGTFRSFPPSHARIENSGIAIYQLRDGKLVRGWLEADRLGVLQQMGAIDLSAGTKTVARPGGSVATGSSE